MTLCGNESMISSSCASEDDAQSNSSSLLSPIDSRYSRLSFQSADKRHYRHRVSFDMLSHQPFISFTLRTANEGYQPKSSSRLFMVTIDDPSHLDDGTTTKLIRYVMVHPHYMCIYTGCNCTHTLIYPYFRILWMMEMRW